jgi:hypothetical protein
MVPVLAARRRWRGGDVMSTRNEAVVGTLVVKPSQNLPQNTTANLYAVSGGAVLVTGMFGLVSSALGATPTNMRVGTSNAISAIGAVVAVTSLAAGSFIVPSNGGPGSGANTLFTGSVVWLPASIDRINPVIVSTPNITWSCDANNTGQVRWFLYYVPIDAGAVVS